MRISDWSSDVCLPILQQETDRSILRSPFACNPEHLMPIVNRIAEFAPEMTEWRRDLHAHPELGFQEQRTSDVVAAKPAEWGIEVHRGLGGPGVGGVQKAGNGGRAIGLRAHMAARPVTARTGQPQPSTNT